MIRSDEGRDAHGNVIPSKLLRCGAIKVGPVSLEGAEVMGFEFSDHLREKMEGVPAALGYNVISKARWGFNLDKQEWFAIAN